MLKTLMIGAFFLSSESFAFAQGNHHWHSVLHCGLPENLGAFTVDQASDIPELYQLVVEGSHAIQGLFVDGIHSSNVTVINDEKIIVHDVLPALFHSKGEWLTFGFGEGRIYFAKDGQSKLTLFHAGHEPAFSTEWHFGGCR